MKNRESVNRFPRKVTRRRPGLEKKACVQTSSKHSTPCAEYFNPRPLPEEEGAEEPSPTLWNAVLPRCGSVLETRHEAVTPAWARTRKAGHPSFFSLRTRKWKKKDAVIYVPRLLAKRRNARSKNLRKKKKNYDQDGDVVRETWEGD